MGHAFFLLALSDALTPPDHITAVLAKDDSLPGVMRRLPLYAQVTIQSIPTPEYPLQDGKTTYYVCTDKTCLPPSHHPALLKKI